MKGSGIMNLKDFRDDYKLSQNDLAEVLNCTQAKISHLELGRRKLNINDLAKLIKAFNLTADYYHKLILDSIKEKEQD